MSGKLNLAGAFGAVIFLTLSFQAANAEQLVVAEARGIGLQQGSMVDSTKPLPLKDGQHVTLISQTGVTIKMDGPSNSTPDSAKAGGVGLGTKLAALSGGNVRLGEVGTTRGTKASKLPSPWLLDFSRAGVVCLKDGDVPVLWRPAAGSATKLSIAPDDRSWRAELTWPARADRVQVGSGIPLRGGVTYFVGINGDQFAVSIDAVPVALTTDEMRAAWMAQKGCNSQAEAMLQAAR